jgi:hypothetical protein
MLTVREGLNDTCAQPVQLDRSVHHDSQKSGSAIVPDTYPSFGWHPQHTTVFNVHLLNSEGACDVFGQFSPDLGEDGRVDVMTSNTTPVAAAPLRPLSWLG